jgi:hypothetical protein
MKSVRKLAAITLASTLACSVSAIAGGHGGGGAGGGGHALGAGGMNRAAAPQASSMRSQHAAPANQGQSWSAQTGTLIGGLSGFVGTKAAAAPSTANKGGAVTRANKASTQPTSRQTAQRQSAATRPATTATAKSSSKARPNQTAKVKGTSASKNAAAKSSGAKASSKSSKATNRAATKSATTAQETESTAETDSENGPSVDVDNNAVDQEGEHQD